MKTAGNWTTGDFINILASKFSTFCPFSEILYEAKFEGD